MFNIKENWQNWLKILGIMFAIIIWAISTQAKVEEHLAEQNKSLKLLMLICKHTAKAEDDRLACYEVR